MQTVIDHITEMYRQREDQIKARMKLQNQATAIIRRVIMSERGLVYGHNTDDKDREKIKKEAATAFARHDPIYLPLIMTHLETIELFQQRQKEIEKSLVKLGEDLPVQVLDYMERTKGFAMLSLVGTIGITGNLNNYDTISKVWKRLGLAVINGNRQGNPGKDATAEDWIEHGYNGRRRSHVWNIGECLVKAQVRSKPEQHAIGLYGQFYLLEKYRQEANGLTPGHANNRAKRRMTKELIKNLTLVWWNRLDDVTI